MHIGIDISQIVYQGTGVARFTYHLTQAILASQTKHQFTFFFSSLKHELHADIAEAITQSSHRLLRWYIPPRMLSMMWNERSSRNVMPVPGRFDIFISSDWTQPPAKIAQYRATVVHDLVYRTMPETVDPLIRVTQTKRMEHVVRECSHIWCDSASTAHDLRTIYPDTHGAITVNYPGVVAPASLTSSRFNFPFDPGSYFFAVGKIEPRKNLKRLLEAFLLLIKDPHYAHMSLVIAGPRGWDVDTQLYTHPNIHLLGSVTDEELALLYTKAFAFVYPSLYEGFGIPPLEAMLLGCPVILSNSSSLKEIADSDSALYFNPLDVDDLLENMRRLLHNAKTRTHLISHGQTNARRYTYEAYLTNMLKSIDTI